MNYKMPLAKIRAIIGKRKFWLAGFVVVIGCYWISLPRVLFTDPYSTVLQASNRALLSASIATDGQWRFPECDRVPSKFAEAIVTFEDKRFWNHPGVDLLSLGRAFRQNIGAGKIVSGGSTLSMQVIRLSRKNKSRTVFEKIVEMILATRLELRYSKEEILSLYTSHAPLGGNVVGLEAACWRYFGTDSKDLSWSQAALLAVLPNSPSLMHPGKNRHALKIKRDRLLAKLKEIGRIDELTYSLAIREPVPDQPHALPRWAPHLLTRMSRDGFGERTLVSTVDYDLQQQVESILVQHQQRLKANQIFNCAALILDVKTGNVLAYAGNVSSEEIHENDVDIIMAPRSTGSILKPFLYAAMIDDGKILPHTLLPDVPVIINGFAPKNFTHEYDGVVHADRALIRSLNIPAVHMLKTYRHEKFYTLLRNMGMTTLSFPPDHYGLSLILGGAEGTLWDITGMYASMARTLNNYYEHPGKNRYYKKDFHAPTYYERESETLPTAPESSSWLSAESIYITTDALKELYRPGEEAGWKYFSSARKIAWKTGTSFGFRDGWAIGITPDYAVGVWAGNADGEGRPGLTGSEAAAPVMFDIFSRLSGNAWFAKPHQEMREVIVCRKSGYRVSALCTERDTVDVTRAGLETAACPYHKILHLTKDLKYQVHSDCEDLRSVQHVSWFVLPPIQEFYYRLKNISYRVSPPYRKGCEPLSSALSMDIVYPKPHAKIFIPRDLDGKAGSSVFELVHRNPQATVFWHLDGKFMGTTKQVHHLAINPGEGKHWLVLVDDHGLSIERTFEVLPNL